MDFSVIITCCGESMWCVYVVQFSQNAELRQQLTDTGNARIVFLCASDSFLGSGCDAETLSREGSYRGKNWLGKSLMKLQEKFQVFITLSTQGFVFRYYFCQGGYVFVLVCLWVIAKRVANEFLCDLFLKLWCLNHIFEWVKLGISNLLYWWILRSTSVHAW